MDDSVARSVHNAPGNDDRERATAHLRARYADQAHRFPTMRADIPVARYVRVNLRGAIRNLLTGRTS